MYIHETPSPKRSLKDRLRRKKKSPKQTNGIVDNPFRVPLQRFFILPHEEQTIIGRLGTNILFPANAFVYNSGAPVFEEVEIELKEVMTKRDVVRENLSTTSNGEFLESGGMLYINASSGGENVYLNPETPAQIEMPRSQNIFLEKTDLFVGQRRKDQVMNWRITETSLHGTLKKRNAIMRRIASRRNAKSKFNAFVFESTILGWMSCDRFFYIPEEKITNLTIEVNVDEVVEMKVVLKESNSIFPVFKKGDVYVARVPENKKATIVGFCEKGEQFFLGRKEVLLGEEKKIRLNMEEKTLVEIKKLLKKF